MNVEDIGRASIVLVHGAWHGGWCWRRVVEPLQAAAGEPVWTPTLRGLGDRREELAASIGLQAHTESMATRAPDWIMPALAASADAEGDGWAIAPPPAELVGVSEPDDAAWLARLLTPQPLLTFTEATRLRCDVDAIGCEAILCRDGIGIPFAAWADGFGWPAATIDCGHDAMVIEPERLASLLAGAVGRLRDR
jgi:Alpha/beta hydrolase family